MSVVPGFKGSLASMLGSDEFAALLFNTVASLPVGMREEAYKWILATAFGGRPVDHADGPAGRAKQKRERCRARA